MPGDGKTVYSNYVIYLYNVAFKFIVIKINLFWFWCVLCHTQYFSFCFYSCDSDIPVLHWNIFIDCECCVNALALVALIASLLRSCHKVLEVQWGLILWNCFMAHIYWLLLLEKNLKQLHSYVCCKKYVYRNRTMYNCGTMDGQACDTQWHSESLYASQNVSSNNISIK